MATAFEQLGGQATIERVHKIFYDKVYAHPWMRQFFQGVEQAHIEAQQTAFMMGALGGPKRYVGKTTKSAHKHMYITQELYKVRHHLLRDSLKEAGVPREPGERWLRIDHSFMGQMVRQHPGDCERRYPSEPVVVIPDPRVRKTG